MYYFYHYFSVVMLIFSGYGQCSGAVSQRPEPNVLLNVHIQTLEMVWNINLTPYRHCGRKKMLSTHSKVCTPYSLFLVIPLYQEYPTELY